MPVKAAGWRIEPPVSDPKEPRAEPTATAAAEPPDDPPGTVVVSHGFNVGPYAEFSVDEPIANSSMLVLPTITAPALRRRMTAVPSYGGRHPARICDEQVVSTPRVHMLSLSATGIPVSGPAGAPEDNAASAASAAVRAPTRSSVR